GRPASIHEPVSNARIAVSVGKHDEAFFDENLRRLDQARRIRQQRTLVADHLHLHHVGHAGGPGDSRVAQPVRHGVPAVRLGQDRCDRVPIRHLTRLFIQGDAHGKRIIPYAAETVSTAQAPRAWPPARYNRPWSPRAIWRSPPSSTASPTSWNPGTPTPSGS